MQTRTRDFVAGLSLTALVAAAGWGGAALPGLRHLGPLSVALLLGMVVRGALAVDRRWHRGIAFSARTLLRVGIILLGVRLNLGLVLHAGPKVLLLDLTVVAAGVIGISWFGRRLGLDPALAALIAVDSSICGASAAAAAAPTLRVRDADLAMVIPTCSVIGTLAMLGFTLAQHLHPISTLHYGLIAGATLPEVAQVMAAIAPVPNAIEIGTVTKLTRVVLLVPVVIALGRWIARRGGSRDTDVRGALTKPWFVLGFMTIGIVNSAILTLFPFAAPVVRSIDGIALGIANGVMGMAMAGMGLQIDLARLRANGARTLATASVGWGVLACLAFAEVWVMRG